MKLLFSTLFIFAFLLFNYVSGDEIICEHPRIELNGKCYLPHEIDKLEAEGTVKVDKKDQKEGDEKKRIEAEKKKKAELIKKNFTVIKNGVSWSQRSPKPLDHSAAIKYCENLGGKLPAIDQLRNTLTMCKTVEKNGACKVTSSCADREKCRTSACNGCATATGGRYSLFGDTGWFWTSTVQTDDKNKAWFINFNQGLIDTADKKSKGNVRCVTPQIQKNP